jgi:polyribonucleotide nucleotidyltransferase
MMVEAGAQEISSADVLKCIAAGHEVIKELVAVQEQMVADVGVAKMEVVTKELPQDLIDLVSSDLKEKIVEALHLSDKKEREDKLAAVKTDLVATHIEENPEREGDLRKIFEKVLKDTMRELVVTKGLRADGRSPEEIRPISCDLTILPKTHGSAIFTRGQTQVLNICTLSALRDMQMLDGLGLEESKRFIHHYNFPPYSVGEAGFMRGPGRREIGHGALAEKALEPVIPSEDDFPYTIRLVSEVLESNGSTSMASVCSGSLSMMDTGVPIRSAVAGIAMGLIKEGDDVVILSDIQGLEDFLGDMDFKVAGTDKGITALQMDIKIKGISNEILEKALEQADRGYRHILGIMNEAIDKPREELSPTAPRMIRLQIGVDKIRDVIGPGGRMINKIIAETGVNIDIEPDGRVFIAAVEPENGKKAQEMIEALVRDVEPGEIYMGKVTRVERYGAFVELLPGKEGLLHISHLDHHRVEKTEDVVKLGDKIEVKVLDIDEKGRINISRKALLPRPEGMPEDKGSDRDRGGSRGGGDRGSRSRPGNRRS